MLSLMNVQVWLGRWEKKPNEKEKSTQQQQDTTAILYAFATSVTVKLKENYIG